MPRSVELQVGINGAFLTRRWEEPENWMRLTRECGFTVHSFCGDVIDPFFSGDRDFQLEQARAVRKAAAKYGVMICDLYTGVATHRFHGLSHSDARARNRMVEWIEQAAELAVEMGAPALGGHWDAFSVETLSDSARTEEAKRRLYQTFRDLSVRLKASGLKALYQEQMYIPSEKPWTLDECEEFLVEANRDSEGIPVYVTLDTGHMAGSHYGLSGEETDYVAWLKRFASVAEVIHLQQTTRDASHHWAFTDDYNVRGHVKMDSVIEAIRHSHAHHYEQPFSRHIGPVDRTWLVAEIIPGSTRTENAVLRDLTESAAYFRQYVPIEGVSLSIA